MEDKGAALRAAPFGVLVVFHLVRISYVLASFPEPVLARFSTKFADSENSLPQGASSKSLPEASSTWYQLSNAKAGHGRPYG